VEKGFAFLTRHLFLLHHCRPVKFARAFWKSFWLDQEVAQLRIDIATRSRHRQASRIGDLEIRKTQPLQFLIALASRIIATAMSLLLDSPSGNRSWFFSLCRPDNLTRFMAAKNPEVEPMIQSARRKKICICPSTIVKDYGGSAIMRLGATKLCLSR